MTEREMQIVRMALIYLLANHDDACEAFTLPDDNVDVLDVNGEKVSTPTEEEIAKVLKLTY